MVRLTVLGMLTILFMTSVNQYIIRFLVSDLKAGQNNFFIFNLKAILRLKLYCTLHFKK